MSFNRNKYDMCSYKYQLAESAGSGIYQLTRPNNVCEPCLPNDPRIVAQTQGVSISKNTSLIDIDSELIGIGRNLSDCPDRKYIPNQTSSFHCGAQTGTTKNGCSKTDKLCIDNTQVLNFGDCFTPTEDTRLSNPPSTLRGTGWNRWEWLCKNPQANLEEPYDLRINSRLLSKDNHRPCIPKPIDQFLAHPEYNEEEVCEKITPLENTCAVPTSPPSVQWQSLNNIQRY